MTITLLLFAACAVLLPASMTGQEVAGALPGTDSAPIVFARSSVNRVGISTDRIDRGSSRIRNDSTEGVHVVEHIRHAVIGGVLGTLAGAAVGGAAGLWIDTHPSDDAMIPATYILGFCGAIAGLAVGLITGAVWPVH